MKMKTITTIIIVLLLAATPTLVLNIVTNTTTVYAIEDVTPPVLNDVWVTPSTVNDGETITIYADITDDISGTKSVFPIILSPTADQWIQFGGLDYNPSSGLWEKEVTIPQYAEAGVWTVDYVECRDNVQNNVFYYYGTDYTADFTVSSGYVPVGDIWSSDGLGNVKNSFSSGQIVYVTVPEAGQTVSLYVVDTQSTWNDGDILTDVSLDGIETVTLNSGQGTQTIQIWVPPTIIGNYDIVMDVDQDGVFDAQLDQVDSLEITGFSVIPEAPLGTIMLSASMFVALAAFIRIKRYKNKP
ncbi:MAG: hypothetical protein NWF06_05740 [Candidatus Bathyarchaeota archaeon]|nr:hypothetical protein [Candidatus Bathyarchaeum sp.]